MIQGRDGVDEQVGIEQEVIERVPWPESLQNDLQISPRPHPTCQDKICSANGCRQAEVLPEPTAPKMATPVYSPRSGIVSQEGLENLPDGDRMMDFPDHNPGAGIAGLQGQLAKRRQIAVAGLELDPPNCDEKQPAD